MKRPEIVRAIQNTVNTKTSAKLNREAASMVLDIVLEALGAGLATASDGDGVTLRNFGAFTVRQRDGHDVPALDGSGAKVEVLPYKAITFRAAPALKDLVNGRV